MFLLSQDHLGNRIINFNHPNLTKIIFDKDFTDHDLETQEKVVSTRFEKFRNWQNSGCNCVQIGLILGYTKIVLLGMDQYRTERFLLHVVATKILIASSLKGCDNKSRRAVSQWMPIFQYFLAHIGF